MTVPNYNHEVAEKLNEIASLLQAQHANPFRSRAYHNAARVLHELPEDVRYLVQNGDLKNLIALPSIGAGIARCIYEYIVIGRMSRLENLKGESDPVSLIKSIPTVGTKLAQRIHDTLHIETLESLEKAVKNGQIDKIEGLGSIRKQMIESWLSKHLNEVRQHYKTTQQTPEEPNITLLLEVDAEYREKVQANKLPLIAPKRFNPDNKAWLPILHSSHHHWHFTALYSNTALAHKLNRVHDWVIIYFHADHHQEGQRTVVTENRGSLTGQRVVRGKEAECFEYYESNN